MIKSYNQTNSQIQYVMEELVKTIIATLTEKLYDPQAGKSEVRSFNQDANTRGKNKETSISVVTEQHMEGDFMILFE